MDELANNDDIAGNASTTDFDFGTPVSADFLSFGSGGNGDARNSGSDSGDVDGNGTKFDPSEHVGRDKFNADGSYRRKRGRRAGTSNNSGSKSKAGNKAGVESLTRALAMVHLALSSVTKTPELVLEDNEAEMLANATHNVLVEFDIRPDPKAEAIFGLVVAATTVYGPRVYLIRQRKKAE